MVILAVFLDRVTAGLGNKTPLAKARAQQAQDAAELPEASGDAIAREFEQFLRRRRETD